MANANSLANLRPWTAEDRSYRGAPKPKHQRQIVTYIRAQTKDGQEMADFMLSVLRGQLIKRPGMVKQRRYPSIKDRMAAADWLATRAFGMPKEFIEVTEGEQERAQRQTLIAAMSPEDREALMALLRRAIEAQVPPAPQLAAPANGGPHA